MYKKCLCTYAKALNGQIEPMIMDDPFYIQNCR